MGRIKCLKEGFKIYKINEDAERYRIYSYKHKIDISYSKKKYGPLAEKLATMSAKTGIKYNNLYKICDDSVIVYLYNKKCGIAECYIDLDDFEKVSQKYWGVKFDSRNLYAIRNDKKLISMHRYILGLDKHNANIVDHKDGNGLNNRKSNLRMVDDYINSKNTKLSKNNTSGIKGISINKNRYQASINDKYKTYTKSFSIKKYGKSKALQMAIDWRKKKEIEFGYYNLSVRKLFKK